MQQPLGTSSYVVWFDDERADLREVVGGKGANLGRLVRAGFDVPPGFTVSTEAYSDFMRESGVGAEITDALTDFDYAHAAALEDQTARIRERIVASPMPDSIAAEISAAQRVLAGEDGVFKRSAVRSSGTAEDLAESSFAGMHDTYLDIHGTTAILDAVKRCWASLWTARATSYRASRGFDHSVARLAVVVQEMVNADVAGVMFTANPLTARVDEFVINASWGLGEAVVSGQVTPDEFVLSRSHCHVKRLAIGSKALRVVRDDVTGNGTVTESVADDLRAVPSLTDTQAADLASLGARVMTYYGGLPQDIEWALADGHFYLLQSRDVTGVEFTWDEDIDESFQRDPEQHDDILWTNQWAREFWTGAITPLHYSVRGLAFEYSNEVYRKVLGFEDIVAMRLFKYRRGTTYFNSAVDALHYQYIMPQALRAGVLGNVHPQERDAVMSVPFDTKKAITAVLRAEYLQKGHGLQSWLDEAYGYIDNSRADALFVDAGRREGLPAEAQRKLSDVELRGYIEARMQIAADFNAGLWDGFFSAAPFSFSLLGWIIENWYAEADDPAAFQNLLSGLPENWMIRESRDLWDLGCIIRNSPALIAAFQKYPGPRFFEVADEHDPAAGFAAACATFMQTYGHRGHADRDMYYTRRCEDIGLLYDALRSIVASDAAMSPHVLEQQRIGEREATTKAITKHLMRQPLGSLKAQGFIWTLGFVHRFLTLREDERWCYDHLTMAKKRAFEELGRRLLERGHLAGERDFYFLAKEELFDVLDSVAPMPLVSAKIKARRTVFERFLAREEIAPMYMRGDQVVMEEPVSGDGGLRGTGTSRGVATARARVVRNLQHIGKVEKGDILICNATDPGWASVFVLIKGLVIESGGLLCHGACLSREYGLPAVTLENAMNLIPDGALVTVNGDSGEISIVDEGDNPDSDEVMPQPIASAN
jgi:phosphohistidine swiveling domain-containing protein